MHLKFNLHIVNNIFNNIECADDLGNLVSSSVQSLAGTFTNQMINIITENSNKVLLMNKLLSGITQNTTNWLQSITPIIFDDINYSQSVYVQLLKVISMIFDDLPNETFAKLFNNKRFLEETGALRPLLDQYKKNRDQSYYEPNSTKFWSVMLTGLPGTGKTIFMQMAVYMMLLLQRYCPSIVAKKQEVLFLTGSFLLTFEDEIQAMQTLIDALDEKLNSVFLNDQSQECGSTVVLVIDECELLFREKKDAGAVGILIEFMSRIRNSIAFKRGKIIILASTNSGNSFDAAAFRRFIGCCIFDHIEPSSIIKDLLSKANKKIKNQKLLQVLNSNLGKVVLEEFMEQTSEMTFGENDNIISHMENYLYLYEKAIYDQYIIILLFALSDFFHKASVISNQHNSVLTKNKVNLLCNIVDKYYFDKYKINTFTINILNLLFATDINIKTDYYNTFKTSVYNNIYAMLESRL